MSIKLELTEKEYNEMLACIDTSLRTHGLNSLAPIVNLYNVLTAARERSGLEEQKQYGQKKEEKE